MIHRDRRASESTSGVWDRRRLRQELDTCSLIIVIFKHTRLAQSDQFSLGYVYSGIKNYRRSRLKDYDMFAVYAERKFEEVRMLLRAE